MSKNVLEKELDAAVFKFNMALVVETLKKIGCVSAGVSYNGDRHSGNINCTFYTLDVGIPNFALQSTRNLFLVRQYVQTNFNKETKKYDHVIAEKPSNLELLVPYLCNHCLTASGNAGYGDEDGGGGTFSINVQTGAVQLAHYKNGVEREYSTFSINPQTGEASRETPEEDADAAETAPAAPSA